jgi:Protein of unknown function (DUF2924)
VNLAHDLAALPQLTVAQLRQRYADIFGEPTNSAHKAWLVKRIAWRWQASAEGDLSERARQRAALLANDADLRLSPPKTRTLPAPVTAAAASCGSATPEPAPLAPDRRLPLPGAILSRPYKGQQLHVTVLQSGFAYQGKVFASLSAVAKAITGSHCNGYLFFHLATRETRHER